MQAARDTGSRLQQPLLTAVATNIHAGSLASPKVDPTPDAARAGFYGA